MIAKPHLLTVDDEPGIRESLASILKDEGYLVDAVGSAEEALERVAGGALEARVPGQPAPHPRPRLRHPRGRARRGMTRVS